MGTYSNWIFPHICDLVLRGEAVSRQRRELLTHARGRILEIGFGTGLNLPHYPDHVDTLTVVDPNPGMHRLARRRLERTRIVVDCRLADGEHLPFDQDSFECVVSTFTLCSIHDPDQALREIHRVLKSGGRFLFLEHGLSPDPGVRKWQRRLNWLEIRLADGCHLDRDIRQLVADQAFAALHVEAFYLAHLPRTHGYLYRGLATK